MPNRPFRLTGPDATRSAILCGAGAVLFLLAILCRLGANSVLAYSFLCAVLFQVISGAKRSQLAATGVLGSLFLGLYWACGGVFHPKLDYRVIELSAFWGIGSLLVMTAQYLWAEEDDERNRIWRPLRGAYAVIGFCLTSYTFLALCFPESSATESLDLYLYSLDLRLGCAWSFHVGRWFQESVLLRESATLVYQSLLLGIAVVYVSLRNELDRLPVNVIWAFLVATVLGTSIYFIVPAAGPLYAFGASFPAAVPVLHPLKPILMRGIRLNAMPSLHLAWTLLALWNSRAAKPSVRVFAAVFFLLTGLATLGLGEHYLVDLIVAVPFALGIQALCAQGLSWRRPVRVQSLAFSAAVAGLWLAGIRSNVLLAVHPALLWMFVAASVGGAVALEQRLYRAARQPQTIPACAVLRLQHLAPGAAAE